MILIILFGLAGTTIYRCRDRHWYFVLTESVTLMSISAIWIAALFSVLAYYFSDLHANLLFVLSSLVIAVPIASTSIWIGLYTESQDKPRTDGPLAGRGSDSSAKFDFFSALTLFGLVMAVVTITAVSFMALHMPAMGWDVMDFWVDRGIALYSLIDGDPNTYDPRYTPHTHRHPDTLSWLLILSAAKFGPLGPPSMWVLCYLTVVCAGTSFIYEQTRSVGFAVIGTWLISGLPLLTNHVMLWGYAELWVACVALIVVSKTSEALQKKSRRLLAIAIFFYAPCLLLLKNVGMVIFLLYAISLCLSYFRRPRAVLWAALMFLGLVTLAAPDFISGVVGWPMALVHVDATENLEAIFTAVFRNSSFGIVPIMLLLASTLSIRAGAMCDVTSAFALVFFVLFFTALFFATLLVPHFSESLQAGRDTLFSRTTLVVFPAATCWALIAFHLWSDIPSEIEHVV